MTNNATTTATATAKPIPSLYKNALELGARARARRLYSTGALSAGEAGRVLGICAPIGAFRERTAAAGRVIRAARGRDTGREQARSRAVSRDAGDVRARGGARAVSEGLRAVALPASKEPARDMSRGVRYGTSALTRGLLRRADRLGDAWAAAWIGRNAKLLTNSTFREGAGGAAWVRAHRVSLAIDGAAWESITRADVLAAFRCEVLGVCQRLARALVRWRARAGAGARLIQAAKRAARKRGSRTASAEFYAAKGRDGREVGAGWKLAGTVDARDGLEDLRADAMISALGEGVPCLRAVPSSAPRDLHSGGFGRRAADEVAMHQAVARARAEIARRLAKAAAGGKGAGAIKAGAESARAMLAHVEAALAGKLPESVIVELTAGNAGGMSDKMRQRVKTFRDLIA